MSRLTFISAGESHGRSLSAIVEGLPSGIPIDVPTINHELARRQQGFGRGGRMKIETDTVEVVAGVWRGKTTGAPLQVILMNHDAVIEEMPDILRPRPGHADLVGALKYSSSIRPILERASARETTMRVAVGSIAQQFLGYFDIEVMSHVVQVGRVVAGTKDLSYEKILRAKRSSQMNCASIAAEKKMVLEIKKAAKVGDSLGGAFQVRAKGVPVGLGSHVFYKRKLDGRIAQAFMSLQSIKAVEIGLGAQAAETWGSDMQDAIFYDSRRGFFRKTNHAGGFEGGITNGEEVVVTVTMKPIATLKKALSSINLKTLRTEKASFERSDVCAVPAGSVIGEGILAFELADALLEKTGGDSLVEVKRNYQGYLKQIAQFRVR